MKVKIVGFLADVVKEMRKVTWPKKEELRETTAMVLIFCVLASLAVWSVDTAISVLLKELYGAVQ